MLARKRHKEEIDLFDEEPPSKLLKTSKAKKPSKKPSK
jgi:hypothetical protein